MQYVRAKPPAFQRAGAEVFDQHVCGFHQLFEDGLAFGCPQVQRQRLLVARDDGPEKALAILFGRAPATGRVWRVGGLDLDDFGAKVAKQLRTERPGNELAKLYDAQARERGGN